MIAEREKFPPELLARIREVGALCILAGCTAPECIDQAKRIVEAWPARVKASA